MNVLNFILIYIVFQASFFAQENLVPNYSFEEYKICPDIDSGYFISNTYDWFSTGISTVDYFNACSEKLDMFGNYSMSVPNNLYGFQNARTGNAYIGLATELIPNGLGLYEYASIKLKSPLIAGNRYELSYYVNLIDKSIWYDSVQYFNSFGAVFTEMNVQSFYNGPTPYIFPLEPQIQSDRTFFYKDSLSWQKVSGTFIANGGEEYVTIGTFDKFDEVKSNFININGNIEVYYFVDDVTLISLGNIQIPNVFTPNFDGLNDVFVIKGNIEDAKLTIMNRWGNIVYQSDTDFYWDGKSNNRECSEGNYTVVFLQGKNTNHSFLQLIR